MEPITTGLAIASLASNVGMGFSAKSKAKKAASRQAKLTFTQRQEEIRQRRSQADFERGAGRAAVGASNVQFSGSSQRYLNALDFENMREIAWAENAARMERRAIRAGASGAGAGFFAQAAGDAIGLAASLYANRLTPSISDHATAPGGGRDIVSLDPGDY